MRIREIYDRPAEYAPPRSSDELLARYRAGERFFEGAELAGADFFHTQLDRVNFRHADLNSANFKEAFLWNCDLSYTNCRQAVFDHGRLANCSLAHADLGASSLYHAGFYFVNFLGTDLEGAMYLDTVAFRSDHKMLLGAGKDQPICFVSYANADYRKSSGLVHAVSECLTRWGTPNWFQPRASWLEASSHLSGYFRREIGKCDIYVLLLTAHVPERPFVISEIRQALSLASSGGGLKIIVVCDVEMDLPTTAPFDALAECERITCSDPTYADLSAKLLTAISTSGKSRPDRNYV